MEKENLLKSYYLQQIIIIITTTCLIFGFTQNYIMLIPAFFGIYVTIKTNKLFHETVERETRKND